VRDAVKLAVRDPMKLPVRHPVNLPVRAPVNGVVDVATITNCANSWWCPDPTAGASSN
jgi:hypothetical protein